MVPDSDNFDVIQLTTPAQPMQVTEDRPHRVVEPPPVRLIAVGDVHLPAAPGLVEQLDDFYVGLLEFWRDEHETACIAYLAEKHRLCLIEQSLPIARQDLRAIGIEVRSLDLLREKLDARELMYEWQHALTPGGHQILLQDPAGNWLVIQSARTIL